MKKCSQCFIDKPIIEFHASSKSKDGRQAKCKPCMASYYSAWREQRKQSSISELPQAKICLECHLEKPISQFGKRSVSLDKKHYLCKECQRKQNREALRKHYARKREALANR